ncbi:MAG: type II toxin-antitoxin system RelE/ParE family toxin [Nitrospirae bacterium]|nr:type II toxin-antitoxin system RelE/ParE family toxin [Nitrospirota bacterium]
MRVFINIKIKRWIHKNGILDTALCHIAKEVVEGKVEADLGGGLFKKYLPRTGEGKQGGYRVLIGYKRPNVERIIFLYAFAKKDKANISYREEAVLGIAAENFISANDEQITELLATELLWEVQCYE